MAIANSRSEPTALLMFVVPMEALSDLFEVMQAQMHALMPRRILPKFFQGKVIIRVKPLSRLHLGIGRYASHRPRMRARLRYWEWSLISERGWKLVGDGSTRDDRTSRIGLAFGPFPDRPSCTASSFLFGQTASSTARRFGWVGIRGDLTDCCAKSIRVLWSRLNTLSSKE